MIEFNYEIDFILVEQDVFHQWVEKIVFSEGKTYGDICFIYCDDEYLLNLNKEHLQHDTYTDIITFDYCVGNELCGDIFISIDRVKENAIAFSVSFDNELLRVMSHGILHLCGYKDKSDADTELMRAKEEEKMLFF